MLKKNITRILGILFLTLIFFGVLNYNYTPIVEAETLCPSTMDPDSVECLDYLRDQMTALKNEQSTLQSKLKQEEYEQLSLQEKITYITRQVSETEKVIKSLEVEIAANDVQIKLLEKEILETEDYISLMRQEINQLESSVNKRVTESYKYSFVGALELILDSNGFGSVLRKTKYLAVTRSQDKKSLEEFSNKVTDLKTEEEELQKQQAELQLVRNSQEEEKTDLVAERQNLADQKAEKDRLLAQSKAEEQALATQISKNQELQASYDSAIIAYIEAHGDQMADQGWVSKGAWIGRVSSETHACSTGAHLHFGITTTNGSFSYTSVPLLSGYYNLAGDSGYVAWGGWHMPLITAGSLPLPLHGTVILSQDYHQGYSLDMWNPTIAGDPVYAVKEGQLWKGRDQCGSNYAVIQHPNGWKSIYLHLQ